MRILSKRNHTKIIYMTLFAAAMFLAYIFFQDEETKENKMSNSIIGSETIGSASNDISAAFVVDKTADLRALGYTGQRKIASDSKGRMFVAYRKRFNEYYEIFVAKIEIKDGKFIIENSERPVSVVGGKVPQRVPSIAVDARDVIHVVWYGADSKKNKNDRQIKYSSSADGGTTWTQWENIALVAGHNKEKYWQEHPSLAVGKEDELYLTWEGKDLPHNKQQVKFSMSVNNGRTWSEWKNVNSSKLNTFSRPTILSDSEGKLNILAYSSIANSTLQQIVHSYSEDGGETWSEWKNVSNSLSDSRHVSFGIDANGILHVAWRAQVEANGFSQIHYSLFKDSTWSNAVVAIPSDKFQFFPSIAVDEYNVPYIAWVESSDEYNFPKENPEKGELQVAFVQEGKFVEAGAIPSGSDFLYPNLPLTIDSEEGLPIVYNEREKEGDEFFITLKILDMSAMDAQ